MHNVGMTDRTQSQRFSALPLWAKAVVIAAFGVALVAFHVAGVDAWLQDELYRG